MTESRCTRRTIFINSMEPLDGLLLILIFSVCKTATFELMPCDGELTSFENFLKVGKLVMNGN